MDQHLFTERLDACRLPTDPQERATLREGPPTEDGLSPLDARLKAMADLFWEATPEQRQTIRATLDGQGTWDLILGIRRLAMQIRTPDDVRWLRVGLALGSIDNGREDYRDLIVSLVLLRHAAERVGIATRDAFDEAIAASNPSTQGSLRNARNHAASDIRATIRAFGPQEWLDENETD